MKTRQFIIAGLIFILSLSACSPASDTILVTREGGKCSLEQGSRVKAGEVTIKWTVEQGGQGGGLWILTLDEGKGYQDLVTYLDVDYIEEFPPTWSRYQGDIFPVKPGSQNEKTFIINQGPIYLICLSGESSLNTRDQPVRSDGVLGPIEVVK